MGIDLHANGVFYSSALAQYLAACAIENRINRSALTVMDDTVRCGVYGLACETFARRELVFLLNNPNNSYCLEELKKYYDTLPATDELLRNLKSEVESEKERRVQYRVRWRELHDLPQLFIAV